MPPNWIAHAPCFRKCSGNTRRQCTRYGELLQQLQKLLGSPEQARSLLHGESSEPDDEADEAADQAAALSAD